MLFFLLFQTCDHNTDYEDLKGLDHLAVVDCRSTVSGEEEGELSPDQVHLEFQQLFLPPGQNPALEAQRPPVLRRISDRRHRAEAEGGPEALGGKLRDGERGRAWGDERDRKSRPFPRLYPSIRLAMREIQQIQQVRGKGRWWIDGRLNMFNDKVIGHIV